MFNIILSKEVLWLFALTLFAIGSFSIFAVLLERKSRRKYRRPTKTTENK
ncbi:MAG: hypothetical protein RR632_05005 [Christensenella sp.]